MPITRTPMIDDDGSGTTGTIINNAWKQELYGQIDGAFGAWQTIAHSELGFLSAAGTWTVAPGSLNRCDFTIVGKAVLFSLILDATSLSAPSSALRIVLPARVPQAAADAQAAAPYFNGGPGTGMIYAPQSAHELIFVRDITNTPWQTDAGSLFLRAQCFYLTF